MTQDLTALKDKAEGLLSLIYGTTNMYETQAVWIADAADGTMSKPLLNAFKNPPVLTCVDTKSQTMEAHEYNPSTHQPTERSSSFFS